MTDFNFKDTSDEVLVKLFKDGNHRAGDELLYRYKNKVLALSRRFFLTGGDSRSDAEDLAQEGMCGLYSAMLSFEGETGFSAYAVASVKNRIIDALKKSASLKNSAATDSVSYEDDRQVANKVFTPEDALIGSENLSEFITAMERELSPLEYRTICAYVDGATMNEICLSLNKNYKQIDNALSRAKHKLSKVFVK